MLPMGRLCRASAQRQEPCGSAKKICKGGWVNTIIQSK
jgi:hypothetical protein